jgi:high-affinity iron transporter
MERHFADFKGALRGNDLSVAQRARDAIALDLPRIVELTKPTGSGIGAFFQSFLIILREGFEAILVIGAVVAFLIKTGNRERLHSIWMGIGLGLVASALMAVILQTVFAHLPMSREIIEGVTMLAAVAVLFSVSYWLISKVEAAKWQKFIREKVSTALDHGGGKALAVVAFLAVFREGAETALFYQALFSEGSGTLPLILGIVAGGVALAVIFTLFYRFGVRIPMRSFFTITSRRATLSASRCLEGGRAFRRWEFFRRWKLWLLREFCLFSSCS